MNKSVLSAALLLGTALLAPLASAQELRAVTEDGRRVVLLPDGKWRFDNKARPAGAGSAASNDGISPYQTAVKKISMAFNASEWTLTPRRDSEAANKRMFQHRSLPLYAMVIADEMPASNEAMKNVLLTNAASAGFATTTLLDEQKQLSNHQIGNLRFTASNKGVDFVFSAYYYADEDGNVQAVCYTGQALFHKYQADCEKFLSGLVIK
ncbi:hypothetical protein [Pelomonas cellulosilytica]|uniref:DUF1795 domain-containing protein n=1 Tax=Pelomonas cellulosilytica TaxID=2906762 RepID=A0ABS8XZP1_9BURK|nr:hypothetical protein [Pelomonas sp. P8]MCE4557453.1 hypothetical protein [Pelomonas sp. P8]